MLNTTSIRQLVTLSLIAVTALFSACKDETGTLGLDILPPDDMFKGTDTATHLSAWNEMPPIRVRSDDPTYAIIGTVDDKYAGKTEASFITQVNLGEYVTAFNKNENYVLDSLVLNLAYRNNWWFGDKFAEHNVQVYRFNEPLSASQTYYSDMDIEGLYNPDPIGTRTSSAWDNQADTTWQKSDFINTWQFKLSDELANEIFNYPEENFKSREAFQNALAGLLVKSELSDPESRGSLITLGLLEEKSNMELYYKYLERDTVAPFEITDTTEFTYTFPINIECVRINRFEHEYSGEINLENPDAQNLTIHGMAGSYVRIDLEESIDFTAWENQLESDSNLEDYYGISAVDLIFKADTIMQHNDTTFYSPIPPSLRIFQLTENETLEQPVYETYDPNTPLLRWFAGGDYNYDTGEYRFRLAGDYFRMMVENPELRGPYYLSLPEPISDARRIGLINNSSPGSISPIIRLKYITFKK
jgi:hypothetical protein